MRKVIDVAAAVIRRGAEVLICSRPVGKPPAGWEFPGGKLEPGESAAEAARRELAEELGVTVSALDTIYLLVHHYPEKSVRLHFVRCLLPESETPSPQEGQQCRFVPVPELLDCDLLPADRPFAEFLQKNKDVEQ